MSPIQILSKLISFPVLGGQSNIQIAQWIEDYLQSFGLKVVHVPNEDGTKRSLHCRIGPERDGGLILSGHMDVVPVKGQTWSSDPFVLTDKKDGKLYGRGACDMKGFVACCLSAVPLWIKADLQIPIYLAFSYDEEIGCLAAPALAKHIKEYYPEKPKYTIVGEPTMMKPVVGQKGIVIYKTTVNGSAGHSSRIKREVSAINEASRLILWLEDKMDNLINSGRIDDRFSPNHTSIHCGLMEQSGIAPNVISEEATFYWDVRVIPQDKASVILEDFQNYCDQLTTKNRLRFPGFDIQTSIFHPDVPPLDTREDLSIVSLIRNITGIQALGAVSYAAEAGQFAEAGFQTVICGPGDIAQAHRADEYVTKDQLDECMKMLEKLVVNNQHTI